VVGVALLALGWLWRRAWFPFVARLCGAGVALGDIDLHLCGRRGMAWHEAPSTFTFCGRWAGSGGVLCSRLSLRLFVWQAWRTSLSVAGVALGDIDLHFHFVWQAWHWAGSGDALGRSWPAVTPQSFVWICVAGVALGDIDLHFVWQAALMALGWLWRRAWSRPARDAAVFCVAGVALGDIGNSLIRTSFTQSAVHSPRNSHTLSHTTCSHTQHHTTFSQETLLHASLSYVPVSHNLPSVISCPSRLHLSFAACWKKLTCGAIRSFNFLYCRVPGQTLTGLHQGERLSDVERLFPVFLQRQSMASET